MISNARSKWRGHVVGVGVVLGLVTLTACGDDGGSLTVGDVELISAGGEDSVSLPIPHDVGQSSDFEIGMSMAVHVAGRSVTLDMDMSSTSEVVAVADGETTMEETIESVEITSNEPEVEREATREVESIIGEVLVSRFDDQGRQVGEVERKDGGSLPEGAKVESADLVFPAEPVGEGASWTVVTEVEQEGFEIVIEETYELVELTDDRYVITISGTTEIDDDIDGVDVEGTMTTAGEVTGSVDDAMDVEMTYELDMDVDMSQGSQSESMTMAVTVVLAPA